MRKSLIVLTAVAAVSFSLFSCDNEEEAELYIKGCNVTVNNFMNESESIYVIKAFSSVTLDGLFFIQSGDRLSVNVEDFLNFNYTGNPAYIY